MKIQEIASKEDLKELMEHTNSDSHLIKHPIRTISIPGKSAYEVARLVQDYRAEDFCDSAIGATVPVLTFIDNQEYEAMKKFLRSRGVKFNDEK